MKDITVFELDDDFDPLEDIESETADQEHDTDYLPPIPDAELSRVPTPVALTPDELIERLITGIPGQRFRLLHAVAFCETPHTLDEIVADLAEAFPTDVSVYDGAQLVQLLEEAQALSSERSEEDSAIEGELEPAGDEDYIMVKPAAPRFYTATAPGLDAVKTSCGEHVVYALLAEEPRYLPLYKTILDMTSQPQGCPTKEMDAVIDTDPLCVDPRRFCGYFLGRLEKAGALVWRTSWITTDLGKSVLASDIFSD